MHPAGQIREAEAVEIASLRNPAPGQRQAFRGNGHGFAFILPLRPVGGNRREQGDDRHARLQRDKAADREPVFVIALGRSEQPRLPAGGTAAEQVHLQTVHPGGDDEARVPRVVRIEELGPDHPALQHRPGAVEHGEYQPRRPVDGRFPQISETDRFLTLPDAEHAARGGQVVQIRFVQLDRIDDLGTQDGG